MCYNVEGFVNKRCIPVSMTSSSSELTPSWKWPAFRLIGCSTHHPSAVVLCSMAPKNPDFLPPSLCQCWCHVAETSPGINFGNDIMCLHFQLGYQQEMKGGRMGLNISWYVVLSPEKGERGTRLATNRRWRVGEWVQTFPSELLTTLLTSRLLLRYPAPFSSASYK